MEDGSTPDPGRKAEIRAEEIYRRAVVDELEKARTSPTAIGKLAKFFQTSFGGFVASSLLLPLLVWLFAALQSHYTKAVADERLLRNLDREISFRLRTTSPYLCDGAVEKFIGDFTTSTAAHPEFANVNTYVLVLQLSELVPAVERPALGKAYDALTSSRRKKDELATALSIRGWHEKLCS